MEGFYGAMGYFFHKMAERAFTYTVIIVVFCYHVIFDKDLICTCENLARDCSFYMTVPSFIILLALLWMDRRFQRAVSLTGGISSVAFLRLFDAFIVALVWNVSVLIEGDWMVCCFDDSQRNVSCKDKYHRTDDDNKFIAEKKNYSRIVGLSLLLCVLALAFVVTLLRKKCLPDKVLWADIVLQKEETLVSEILERKAEAELKTRLEARVRQNELQRCLCVGDELIQAFSRKTPTSRCINETEPLLGPSASSSRFSSEWSSRPEHS